jgi:hypothetical protein
VKCYRHAARDEKLLLWPQDVSVVKPNPSTAQTWGGWMIWTCNITTFKKKGRSFMWVRPSERYTLSFLYSQYHQIYCIFQCIMCTEILFGELCEKNIYWL